MAVVSRNGNEEIQLYVTLENLRATVIDLTLGN